MRTTAILLFLIHLVAGPVETFAGEVVVQLDTDDAPHLAEWGEKARALLVEWHPRFSELLASADFEPPKELSLKIKKSDKGVGATSGTKITVSSGWIEKRPDDLGLVVHELVHVIQRYPNAKPWWITEGIADYLRWAVYEKKPQEWFPVPAKADGYTSGYRVTAGFFLWLETGVAPGIVHELNAAMRKGTYEESIFEKRTGERLDELWGRYVAANKRA